MIDFDSFIQFDRSVIELSLPVLFGLQHKLELVPAMQSLMEMRCVLYTSVGSTDLMELVPAMRSLMEMGCVLYTSVGSADLMELVPAMRSHMEMGCVLYTSVWFELGLTSHQHRKVIRRRGPRFKVSSD